VGGGASLKEVDLSLLCGELVIGANRAYEICNPTLSVTIDGRFTQNYLARKGLGNRDWVFYDAHNLYTHQALDGMFVVRGGGRSLERDLELPLCEANNSGAAALQIAYALGANPIYLLGFDMEGEWHHKPYPRQWRPDTAKWRAYREQLESWARTLRRRGVRVVNLNPHSALRCFEFSTPLEVPLSEDLPQGICFYTENSGYEKEAQRLIRSARRMGVKMEVEKVESTGTWLGNVNMKARYTHRRLEDLKRDILWVDADGEFLRSPRIEDFQGGDVAAVYIDWTDRPVPITGNQIASGTMFIRYSKGGRQFAQGWESEVRKHPRDNDQISLARVLDRSKEWGFQKFYLPESYCAIFDLMEDVVNPVILHHQASRRLKKEVNKKGKGS
jgi:hypothetical protein